MPSSVRDGCDDASPDMAPQGQAWLCLRDGALAEKRVRGPARVGWVLVHLNSLRYEDDVLISARAVNDEEAEISW